MALITDRGITLVGVSLANLGTDSAIQLTLPYEDTRPNALDSVLDNIHDRFGTDAITRAVLVSHDQGFSVPLLPD